MVMKIGIRLTHAIHDGPAGEPAAATSPPLTTRAQINSKACVIRSSDDRRGADAVGRTINPFSFAYPWRRLRCDHVIAGNVGYRTHAPAVTTDTHRRSLLIRITLAST